MKNRKVKCDDYKCGWTGYETDVLTAKNPFDMSDQISGCPKCLQINTIIYACDEPGCWRDVSCGTPTKDGYRSTCGEHAPKDDRLS